MSVLAADDEGFTMETRNASPAHLLLKIESFSLLSKHGIQKYVSKEFDAGGYKWKLEIHPDGLIKSKDEDDHISVYLTIIENASMPVGWEVNAILNIFLYSQILDNYLCFRGKMRRLSAMKSQWGFSKLISKRSLRDPCQGFLVDDTCVFGTEVFVISSERLTERVSLREISNTYKRDWKIPGYSKLGQDWISEEFTTGDRHKWQMKLYPNGWGEEEGRSVSIYFYLIDAKSFTPNEKVKVEYCIRIKNQLNNQDETVKTTDWFSSSDTNWGWPAFIPLSDMRDSSKGFIVNDCCIVELEITGQVVVRYSSLT